MTKPLSILALLFTSLVSCTDASNIKKGPPKNIFEVVGYLDSNRIREFASVSFDKKTETGNNYWLVGDSTSLYFSYEIGYPYVVDASYNFPNKDSLERLWIMEQEHFKKMFPIKVEFPINKEIDMILQQSGLIECRVSSLDPEQLAKKENILLYSIEPSKIFQNKNPFEYFRRKTKIMDSLGITGLTNYSMGNFITITIGSDEGYLDYLPDNLFVQKSYEKVFDSVISTGYKISDNWVWRKKTVAF